jgi:hypothetical protein
MMAEAKRPREKLTLTIDPPVRQALQRKAEELDISEASFARHVLSDWARRQAPAGRAA